MSARARAAVVHARERRHAGVGGRLLRADTANARLSAGGRLRTDALTADRQGADARLGTDRRRADEGVGERLLRTSGRALGGQIAQKRDGRTCAGTAAPPAAWW